MTGYAEVPRLGIGGPVGSGKTALIEHVVPYLQRQGKQLAVITNDILTQEDAQRLRSRGFLSPDRIVGVETGACPHTVIREDPTMNLEAVRRLEEQFPCPGSHYLREWRGQSGVNVFSGTRRRLCLCHRRCRGRRHSTQAGAGDYPSDLLVITRSILLRMSKQIFEVMTQDARQARGTRPVFSPTVKQGWGLRTWRVD